MKQTIFCQNCKEPYINNKSLDQAYPETKLLCPECEEKDLNNKPTNSHRIERGYKKMIEETKKPTEIRYGNVKLVVWDNQDSKGNKYQSYQIQKFYKDSEGNWKTTDSLSEVELLKAQQLIASYVKHFKVTYPEE